MDVVHGFVELERDHHDREEGLDAEPLEVGGGGELELVLARLQARRPELANPTVAIGDAGPDVLPVVGGAPAQLHLHARARRPVHRVEDVSGQAHAVTRPRSRMRAILRSSRFASSSSAAGSFFIRRRSSDRISSPLRPLAKIRNTWPKRSSYRRFSAASVASVAPEARMARLCSRSELVGTSPPRSPIRGCAFIASRHSSSVSWSMARSAGSPVATECAHLRLARQL